LFWVFDWEFRSLCKVLGFDNNFNEHFKCSFSLFKEIKKLKNIFGGYVKCCVYIESQIYWVFRTILGVALDFLRK
jgi:hypothetical protein